jgi:hypothetical protein
MPSLLAVNVRDSLMFCHIRENFSAVQDLIFCTLQCTAYNSLSVLVCFIFVVFVIEFDFLLKSW